MHPGLAGAPMHQGAAGCTALGILELLRKQSFKILEYQSQLRIEELRPLICKVGIGLKKKVRRILEEIKSQICVRTVLSTRT